MDNTLDFSTLMLSFAPDELTSGYCISTKPEMEVYKIIIECLAEASVQFTCDRCGIFNIVDPHSSIEMSYARPVLNVGTKCIIIQYRRWCRESDGGLEAATKLHHICENIRNKLE